MVYPHSSLPSAAGRAQDRVSSPAKDRRSANCATQPTKMTHMHSSSEQFCPIIKPRCFPVYVICRTGSGYSCYLCRWTVHGERLCRDEQHAENNCRLRECCQEGGFLSLDWDQIHCDTVLTYAKWLTVRHPGHKLDITWWASQIWFS